MLPAKSTPAAYMISLVGKTARPASPAATIAAASVPRGVTSTLIFSVTPSRGKRSVVSQIPLVLPGTATVLALSRTCMKASTVLTSGFGAPARTATPTGTCARSTSVPATIFGGDQLTEALSGQDHHVGRHAAGELRGNRLRPRSLRRTRSGRDLDAARPLEFRQQFLVRAAESTGYQNVHLCHELFLTWRRFHACYLWFVI